MRRPVVGEITIRFQLMYGQFSIWLSGSLSGIQYFVTLARMSVESFQTEIDENWLAEWNRGNAVAFDQVYKRFGSQLLAFLARRCGNPEDVANEIWLRIWKNRTSFQSGDFRAWMYQIARNYLITQSRKRSPEVLDNDELYTIAIDKAPEAESEMLGKLKECIDKLSGMHMDVLRERLRGKSTCELAELFNITEANVAKRIWNAKTLLRQCVEAKLT